MEQSLAAVEGELAEKRREVSTQPVVDEEQDMNNHIHRALRKKTEVVKKQSTERNSTYIYTHIHIHTHMHQVQQLKKYV